MPSYLQTYQSGAYEQVYRELLALGPAVRNEPALSEARAVATEMMQRARHNVELIISRLRQLGYAFEEEQPREPPDFNRSFQSVIQQAQYPPPSPSPAWQPPDADLLAELDAFEAQVGPLPLVLRAWYEQVGILDLCGDHPKLSRYHGEGPMSDPLCLWFDTQEIIDQWEEDQESGRTRPRLYPLSLAPDACHKANYSGGGPLEIKVPNPCFDGPLISEDGWDGMGFVPYLRTCFAWGGFPGLSQDAEAAAAAREELAFLTADLLPL